MPFTNARGPQNSLQPGARLIDGSDILGILSGQVNFSSLSLTGLFASSISDGITARAGGGQANSTPLPTMLNRVTTVATAGDSVSLPASTPGLVILLCNAGVNSVQVFGAAGATDTINGIAYATGVSQMPNSEVVYACHVAGVWTANGLGTGFFGSFETLSFSGALVAKAGGGQSGATALTAMVNQFGTVATAGDSAVLPPATGLVAGTTLPLVVINTTATSMNVFAPSGASMNGTLNGSAAVTNTSPGTFYALSPTAWVNR